MIRARQCLRSARAFHGVAPPPPESTHTSEPSYPSLPKHLGNTYLTEKDVVREKMRSLDTVEEKAYYLNLPKYYGWFSLQILENKVNYGSLKFAQSSTATDIVSSGSGMESFPVHRCERSKELTSASLDIVSKYIRNYHLASRPCGTFKNDESLHSIDFKKHKKLTHGHAQFLGGLDRILSTLTGNTFQTDFSPRLEAFWFKGGFDPDSKMINKRRGKVKVELKSKIRSGTLEDHNDFIFEPYERALSYVGSPLITKRCSSFLPSFVSMDDCVRDFESHKEQEEFVHDPRSLGFNYAHVHGRNIPAVWTGSHYPCLNISYLSSLNKSRQLSTETCFSEYYMTPDDEALIKSIFHGFSASLASATYFGFNTFNNPTYPISTRNIVFDGRSLALGAYQLNRTELHQNGEEEEGRDLRNRLWYSPYRELYSLDAEGTLTDVNVDLLEDLIAIYLEKVKETATDSSPYLNPELKYLHQVKAAYDRTYFRKQYLYMNNPTKDNVDRPRVEPWEKIHLIDTDNLAFIGLRERQWFKMAKYDFRGREHWHPEFRKLDYYEPPYLPTKFRKTRNIFKANNYRTRKVTIPIPKDT